MGPTAEFHNLKNNTIVTKNKFFRAVLWIRIRSESGINHLGSGFGQPLSRMNLKQNFSDKIHDFSTKCTIKINKYIFFQTKSLVKSPTDMNVVVISRIKCEFAAQLSGAGDQRYRIRIMIRIRSRSRSFLESRSRSRIRNKSFRIHHPASVAIRHIEQMRDWR